MSPITLEAIQSKQTELAALIQQLQKQAQQSKQIKIEGITIDLQPGEHYAGAALDESGDVMHHLVLMAAKPEQKPDWQAANDWADSVGGCLPSRQEQALLFANCKPHLKAEWHWSSEVYEEDASFAWRCCFLSGSQDLTHKSYEGGAVAVRRVSTL